MGGKIILRGAGLGVLALLANVLVAFLWVWFYSLAVAPGHDGAFYQAYGQRVAPFSAFAAGVPLLLLAGWLAARGPRPLVAALAPAVTYILLDAVLNGVGGLWPPLWSLLLLYPATLAAAWFGGKLAARTAVPRLAAQ